MNPAIREFDGTALHAALNQKRQAEGLSWTGAAAAIWEMAGVLNADRDARGVANHPISPSTLQSLHKRGDTSCQHALFFLRWLDRTPESFLRERQLPCNRRVEIGAVGAAPALHAFTSLGAQN